MPRTDMPEEFTEKEQGRLHSYLNVHLKKDERELPGEEQVAALRQRYKSKWWHLVVNLAVFCLFAYSFYTDITELSSSIFIIIGVVFVINIILIFYQMRQINQLIDYLNVRRGE